MSKLMLLLSLAVVSRFATAQQLPQVAAPPGATLQFQQNPGQALTTPTGQPLPGDFGPPGAFQAEQAAAAQQQLQQQQAAALLQQQQMAAMAKAEKKKKKQDDQMIQQMMQQLMSGMSPGANGMRNGGGLDGNPRTYYGEDGPQNPDGTYSDSQRFWSGEKGVGNIGDGLCTSKNAERTQMKSGHCQMLKEIINQEGSCANQALNVIMAKARVGRIQGLDQYCPNFAQMGDNGRDVFVQVLASLIVQESGWRTGVKEQEWYKGNHAMGGHGLFQIGPKDAHNYSGCSRINMTTIYDPKTNMECGSCIALSWIAHDEHMGKGSNDNPYRRGTRTPSNSKYSIGMARYFGPTREGQAHKRKAMQNAVGDYCRGALGSSVESDVKPGGGDGSTKK